MEVEKFRIDRGFMLGLHGTTWGRLRDKKVQAMEVSDSGTWYAYTETGWGQNRKYICRAKDPVTCYVQAEIMGWEPESMTQMSFDTCLKAGY